MIGFFEDAVVFLALLLALYAATVALYFILGFGVTWVNNRNPERRIQKSRRGEKRMKAEIRQSMASILVTCLSVAIGLFAQHQGWALTPWTFNWWTCVPMFLLTMVLFDTWFYFAHRALHTEVLYKYHVLHHKSVAPTVWSNDSIGLVDTALSQGFYAVIVFILPISPIILLVHNAFDRLNGTFGHAGFEYFASSTSRYPSPMLCTIYHDQHHAEFRFNYANYFSFWDRIMGTISPVYDERVEAFESTAPALNLHRLDSEVRDGPAA